MDATIDRRFVAGVLLTGAVLAMVGNGLHPILDPRGGGAELVAALDVGLLAIVTTVYLAVTVATFGIVVDLRRAEARATSVSAPHGAATA